MVVKHTTYNFDSFLKCTIFFHRIRSQFFAAVNVVYFQLFSSPQEQNVNHEKSLPILCPPPPLPLSIHSSTSCLYGFSSVQFSCSVVSDSLRPHETQHIRPPCPSPTPGVYSNSYPLSQRCHPTISSSVVPFSSCSQSFPASWSFPMSRLFPTHWVAKVLELQTQACFSMKPSLALLLENSLLILFLRGMPFLK